MKTFNQLRQYLLENDMYTDKLEGIKDVHGDIYVRHHKDMFDRNVYTVHHQGNKIASAKLSGQDHYVTDVDVQPEFRRKGVASRLYDFIEKHSGKKLKPSPMYQTGEGKALWQSRSDQ
jgi:ribosomal protein S18 acetylase RimI-like enzyme